MEVIKDTMVSSSVRYTKVLYQHKRFRRFQYYWKGKELETLWLTDISDWLPDFLEDKLEEVFKKEVG